MLNTELKLPPEDERCKAVVLSPRVVVHWPEFLALADRLGLPMTMPLMRIVIDLDFQKGELGLYFRQRGSDTSVTKEEHEEADRKYVQLVKQVNNKERS